MSKRSHEAPFVDRTEAIEVDVADSFVCSGSVPKHDLAVAETSEPQSIGVRFSFEAKGPEEYPPLYLATPGRSTAAVNAGDYRLYVGGYQINGAFAEFLHEHMGLCYDMDMWNRWELLRYTQLHRELLAASRNAGNAFVTSPDVQAVKSYMDDLHISLACAMAGEASDQDTPGHESASGAVFLHVFVAGKRPLAEKNIAMLYTVGPKGEGCGGPKQGPLLNKERFLAGVQELAKRALDVVGTYNRHWAVNNPIEEVRWCLVSGGSYCHPDVQKVEVAAATIHGMRDSAVDILVTFTYDEDAFRRAFEEEQVSAHGLAGLAGKTTSQCSWGSHG